MNKRILLSLTCPLFLGLGTLLPRQNTAPDPASIQWEGSLISTIQVRDLAKAKAFYGDVLGFKLYFDLSAMGWAEMTTPVKHSLIGLSQAKKGAFKTNGGSNISFGVKDIESVHARLKKHKVRCGEIQVIPKTVKLLEFKDLDGNSLMLHQPYVAPKKNK